MKAVGNRCISVTWVQAGYWRDYCELEIGTNTPGAVKALFSRCLLTCLSVDLWRTYLQFIRKVEEHFFLEGIGCFFACQLGWQERDMGMAEVPAGLCATSAASLRCWRHTTDNRQLSQQSAPATTAAALTHRWPSPGAVSTFPVGASLRYWKRPTPLLPQPGPCLKQLLPQSVLLAMPHSQVLPACFTRAQASGPVLPCRS